MVDVSDQKLKQKLTIIAVGVSAALVLTLLITYLLTAYSAETRKLKTVANTISNGISLLVYSQPETWKFRSEWLREQIDDTLTTEDYQKGTYFVQIYDVDAMPVVEAGNSIEFPSITQISTIKDGHDIVAKLSVTYDIRHVWVQATLPGLIGIALGLIIYFVLQVLPMKALLRRESQLRANEIQLRQAQKMETFGQISSGVAHDFNNLLGIIMGHLELLDESLENDDQRRKMIETSLSAVSRGSDLTHRLLSFSSQQFLRPEIINLNIQIKQLSVMLKNIISNKISLKIDTTSGLWKTELDPTQFEAAILNLVTNSEYAMQERGILNISSHNCVFQELDESRPQALSAGPYVEIVISDTGNGMTADTLDKAIEPFFTTKTYASNSGLGLSMVHGFTKQSNGAMVIESKIGEGTTVTLYFPAKATEDAIEEPTATISTNDRRTSAV